MSEVQNQKRDLVLAPGTFAYMQDTTKGAIMTYVGPIVINPTAQEVPVRYDKKRHTFVRCGLEEAVCTSPIAVEGFYIVLLNPCKNDKQPERGAHASEDLLVGRKVNIQGPAMFALWPGQVAEVVRGHTLRSNQYLLCRVYNETEARINWNKSVMRTASSKLAAPAENATEAEKAAYTLALGAETQKLTASLKQDDLTVGKLFIMRGTDVSFYMPPTGVSVVQEGIDANGKANFVREALTLENLEYCILIDEDGNTRYERGPSVVFPEPTEKFLSGPDDKGNPAKKFRAIELNEIQGIHIKVVEDYEEGTKKFTAGQELFITGKDTAIYYPRKEHSAIKYDGKTKHFATAIPSGEARYLLNRNTGEIKMVAGPAMLLPDPRVEVIVRRVLTEKQCALWYPGNTEALEYNRELRRVLQASPTTRAGAVSEGDVQRKTKHPGATSFDSIGSAANYASAGASGGRGFAASSSVMNSSQVSKEQEVAGTEFTRSANYTQPRTVTLDTKYQGAPTIGVWTGYAVMVVSKTGNRKVEAGPVETQLEYDESLEILEFSTGKPKTTDNLQKSPYLRVANNKISDVVKVETSDHVFMNLSLSYRVDFEGEPNKWFMVENYVKFLCDHVRSVLKGHANHVKVEDYYANTTNLVHDTILGTLNEKGERPGMFFKENGMRILDIEVLDRKVENETIRNMLESSQHSVVKTNIDLSNLRRTLEFVKEKEQVKQEEDQAKASTIKLSNTLEQELLVSSLTVNLTKIGNTLKELEQNRSLEKSRQELESFIQDARLTRDRATSEQRLEIADKEMALKLEFLTAETKSIVDRFTVAQGGFSQALLQLSNDETMQKVAEAWSVQKLIGGDNLVDTIKKLFTGTPIEPFMQKILQPVNTPAIQNKNGGVAVQS